MNGWNDNLKVELAARKDAKEEFLAECQADWKAKARFFKDDD
jgi:hypothetical protein